MSSRPLCILNGPMIEQGELVLVNHQTGVVLEEIASLAGGLDVLQGQVQSAELGAIGGLSNHDLNASPLIRVMATRVSLRSRLFGLFQKALLHFRMLVAVSSARWVHLFYPGRITRWAAALCRMLGKPYAVYLRGSMDPKQDERALAGARVVLCNNRLSTQKARELNPNSIQIMPVMTYDSGTLFRDRVFANNKPLRLLHVGRVTKEKGIPELLEAVDALIRQGVELDLHIVGNGPLAFGENLPKTLQQHVCFHGFLSNPDELAEQYRLADVFVLASHSEAFPRVLYEAMTWALPVVCTFVDGIGSIMEDESNCLRVEVQDPQDISRSLLRLAESSELRRTLSLGGLKTIEAILEHPRPSHAATLMAEMETTNG